MSGTHARRMDNWVIVALAFAAMVVAVVLIGSLTEDTEKGTLKGTLTACTHEDGSTQEACYWDADRQGNGKGRSFYSFNYGEIVIYVNK